MSPFKLEQTYLSLIRSNSHDKYIKIGDYETSLIILPARDRIIIEEIKSPKISYSINILETAQYYKNTVLHQISNNVINEPTPENDVDVVTPLTLIPLELTVRYDVPLI